MERADGLATSPRQSWRENYLPVHVLVAIEDGTAILRVDRDFLRAGKAQISTLPETNIAPENRWRELEY